MPYDLAIYAGPGSYAKYLTAPVTSEASLRQITKVLSLLFSDYDARTGLGTTFAAFVRQGNRTNASIAAQFAVAATRLIEQLGIQSDTPVDERITRLVLTSIGYASDKVRLTIEVSLTSSTFTLVILV